MSDMKVKDEWKTSTVLALARTMWEKSDFSALPILADALRDANCDDSILLNYCLSPEYGDLICAVILNAQTTLYLTYEEWSRGGEISPGQENDAFPDREDEFKEFSLLRCDTMKENAGWQREEVVIDFCLKDNVWVVVVRYQTGDTFGTTHGAWKIVGVYGSQEKASEVEASINDDSYEGYQPWTGHFERLESITITKMAVH